MKIIRRKKNDDDINRGQPVEGALNILVPLYTRTVYTMTVHPYSVDDEAALCRSAGGFEVLYMYIYPLGGWTRVNLFTGQV